MRKNGPAEDDSPEAILAQRKYAEKHFFPPLIAKFRERYEVTIAPRMMAGVCTEVVTPVAPIPGPNQPCVLVNLHGGGFTVGARYVGRMESIPVAALGQCTVVSVDYRMAPEYQFPAATEDVVTVYRELLKDYSPAHIAIYGCSAGGVLTAQTVAALHTLGIPRPAAVGMFFGAGAFWTEGDTGMFRPLFAGAPLKGSREHPYFNNADSDDPRVFPVRSTKILRNFPPSILMSATRDHALSSVVHTHSCLVKEGVPTELHVWEGLGHAFFYDPDLPQTHDSYGVVWRFFARQLGLQN